MSKKPRKHADDLRAASRLAIDATTRVVDVVEEMHSTIASGPAILGKPLSGPARLVNGVVYGSIRGVTRLVGAVIDKALEPLAPLLGESAPGPEREAIVAALNGVLGDYLVETTNPLAIQTRLRHDGHPMVLERASLRDALPAATGRILVLVHGSSMSDLGWKRRGHDHGAELAKDVAFTPVYLHYNSGLHVSENGRAFDLLLESLATEWPVPLDQIVLLGHSMGGLVARSACHYADRAGGRAWRARLTKLVCLGTPHHGAPLERGGNWLEVLLGVSRYSTPLARLGKLRSAGVTDLRYGNVTDEHWSGRDRFDLGSDPRSELRLPDGVACYAIAGSLSRDGDSPFVGDGLVPVDSALGRHARPNLALAFPEAHQKVFRGMGHMDLLSDPKVYEALRAWCLEA